MLPSHVLALLKVYTALAARPLGVHAAGIACRLRAAHKAHAAQQTMHLSLRSAMIDLPPLPPLPLLTHLVPHLVPHLVQLIFDCSRHQQLLDHDTAGGAHAKGARDDLMGV